MNDTQATVSKIVGYVNVPRQFGFTKDSVFFHSAQEIIPACDGSATPYKIRVSDELIKLPEIDDEIICVVLVGKKGKKVAWWAYKEIWQATLELIQNRPVFRLVERTGQVKLTRLYSPMDAVYRTLWEGQDMEVLRQRYPISQYSLHEGNMHGLRIDTQVDGKWERVDYDPRSFDHWLANPA